MIMVFCPVGGLELGGWDVAKLAVKSSMVAPLEVGGDGKLDVVDAAPAAAAQGAVAVHSALNSELSASAIALSQLSPLLPTAATASASARRSV
jgi:hypothetical protein